MIENWINLYVDFSQRRAQWTTTHKRFHVEFSFCWLAQIRIRIKSKFLYICILCILSERLKKCFSLNRSRHICICIVVRCLSSSLPYVSFAWLVCDFVLCEIVYKRSADYKIVIKLYSLSVYPPILSSIFE